jgi:hypothetical protein
MKQAHFRKLIVILALGVLVAGAAYAQRRMSDGRRLDANLQVGSGGYNRGVSQSTLLRQQGYVVGRDRSLYVPTDSGGMRYSPNNAFSPRGQYRATGYQGQYSGHGVSASSLRRFRYGG